MLRFLVVGGTSTVVTIGVFNLLVHVGPRPVLAGQPLGAYVFAMLLGLVVNYLGNRHWVFPTSRSRSRASEITSFLLTNGLVLLIPSICLAISRYGLGLTSALADNVAANGIGLILATCSRWLAYRFVVFASPVRRRGETDDG